MKQSKNIVCIGGGTGTFTVLRGLKQYADLDLSAIVSMSDSGGSTGKLRNDLQVLPPGDVRQCLIALSQQDDLMQAIFTYRFEEGDLKGHNLGNIILAGLEKITGSFEEAVKKVSSLLAIKGKVVPVTLQKTDLVAELESGQIVFGEDRIDEPATEQRIKKVILSPEAEANPEALVTIREADYIVIGPGDLYTSIIPNLLVRGINHALRKTKATIIYVCNLMTKFGQTDGMSVSDHVLLVESYMKRSLDIVVLNDRELPIKALEYYTRAREYPVKVNPLPKRITTIRTDLLSERTFSKNSADRLKRSLIRHSSNKLGKALVKLFRA